MSKFLTDMEKVILRQIAIRYPISLAETEYCYTNLVLESKRRVTHFDKLIDLIEESYATCRSLETCLAKYLKQKRKNE